MKPNLGFTGRRRISASKKQARDSDLSNVKVPASLYDLLYLALQHLGRYPMVGRPDLGDRKGASKFKDVYV